VALKKLFSGWLGTPVRIALALGAAFLVLVVATIWFSDDPTPTTPTRFPDTAAGVASLKTTTQTPSNSDFDMNRLPTASWRSSPTPEPTTRAFVVNEQPATNSTSSDDFAIPTSRGPTDSNVDGSGAYDCGRGCRFATSATHGCDGDEVPAVMTSSGEIVYYPPVMDAPLLVDPTYCYQSVTDLPSWSTNAGDPSGSCLAYKAGCVGPNGGPCLDAEGCVTLADVDRTICETCPAETDRTDLDLPGIDDSSTDDCISVTGCELPTDNCITVTGCDEDTWSNGSTTDPSFEEPNSGGTDDWLPSNDCEAWENC
jgi:hypothetical protein